MEVFLEAHREEPEEIILDLDATDDPLHGKQEGRFFHGYYGLCVPQHNLYYVCCRTMLSRQSESLRGAGCAPLPVNIV